MTIVAPARARFDGTKRRPFPLTVARLRLATGLILFAYVLGHFLNHALGNLSLAAMLEGMRILSGFWSLPPMKAALYGAFTIHLGLGLWSLYRRRPFQYRWGEALQLCLGLLIPYLLLRHIVGTRLSVELYGIGPGYDGALYTYFVASPSAGLTQVLLLVVVWVHACIGFYYWLRLKPYFTGLAPVLLGTAVLVPTLALLGFLQGGREMLGLVQDPVWRAAHLGPDVIATGDAARQLGRITWAVNLGYVGLVALVLLARLARSTLDRRGGVVSIIYPDGRSVRVPLGTSVLEASRLNRIPHTAICGGKGRCSTCRVRILKGTANLPRPSAGEQTVLDRVRAGEGVRLACQLRPTGDVTVALLVETDHPRRPALHQPPAFGEERFVVAMFVDMRGSTSLAEHRLPFDTVFVINRFLEAVGGAVAASGGSPNQFLGDGMMALFGLETDREEAARGGLAAIDRIAENIAALNEAMAGHLGEPIRYGIGLHAGSAILGEIGDRRHGRAVFTAIGDAVNVASRLQSMTKRLGVVALVSETVFKTAGEDPGLPRQEIDIEGRTGRLWVRPIGSLVAPVADARTSLRARETTS